MMNQFSFPVHDNQAMPLSDFRDVFETVYENQYFTNHGPLAQEFEMRMEHFLEIDHVVTVGNEFLALLMVMAGLGIEGKLLVPAYQSKPVTQVASWLNIPIVYCDVQWGSCQPSIDNITQQLRSDISCITLIETWGNRIKSELIDEIVSIGLDVIVVAFDSLGAKQAGGWIHKHPKVTTLFSFGPDKIVSTLQGGGIATNNQTLVKQFRNIRSSYGAGEKVAVLATCNGRFSEFQAGLGCKQLDRMSARLRFNQRFWEKLSNRMVDIDSIELYSFAATDFPSYQQVVLRATSPALASQLAKIEGLDLVCPNNDYWSSRTRVTNALSGRMLTVGRGLVDQTVTEYPKNTGLDPLVAEIVETVKREGS